LPAHARPAAPSPEVAALREEIGALQIDRALALTPEQARALLPILRKAAEEAKALRARIESPDPALVAALTRARDELRAGGEISDATRQAIRNAQRAAMGGRRGEFQELRKEALAVLTPAQAQALRHVRLGAGPGFPGGPGLGPDGNAPDAGKGRGAAMAGGGRRLVLARLLTSDAFLGLLEARAR
ncbi:MAG: hypothetical protein WB493_06530, partial [Anaeromyxobacteraceae bacterium]